MSELDLDAMRHALETARRLGLRRVSVREGEHTLTAVLADFCEVDGDEMGDGDAAPIQTGAATKDIAAGHVGYVRFRDPKPELGGRVESGQVVAEIIALGLVNEVVSRISGEIDQIFVGENEPVEFGQPILRVKVD